MMAAFSNIIAVKALRDTVYYPQFIRLFLPYISLSETGWKLTETIIERLWLFEHETRAISIFMTRFNVTGTTRRYTKQIVHRLEENQQVRLLMHFAKIKNNLLQTKT